MAMINRYLIQQLDQENFGPEQIVDQLSYLQEVFYFLKKIEPNLEKIRPVITYAVSVTIWAFRQTTDYEPREIPTGFLDSLWNRLKQGIGGQQLSDFLEKTEPELWAFFLNLLQAARKQENWNQQNLTVASLVYGTILTTCIMIFWPEEKLATVEQEFTALGFYDL